MAALIRAENGTIWDAENQPNPDCLNNDSRTGFLWNCYHHKLGQFFQHEVKNALFRAINAVHQRNNFNFEGEFLIFHNFLRDIIKVHTTEERKQNFLFQIADIIVYYAKNEDELKKIQKNKLFKTSVDFAHRGIQRYDKEAFIFDDNRLFIISSTLKINVRCLLVSDNTSLKVIDIITFLMKEDIYYRPRFINILKDINKNKCKPSNSKIISILYDLCEVVKDFKLTTSEIENIERWH
jgi:hypothetical protein